MTSISLKMFEVVILSVAQFVKVNQRMKVIENYILFPAEKIINVVTS